jgi:hypothetical protein
MQRHLKAVVKMNWRIYMPAFSTFKYVLYLWKKGDDSFWDRPAKPSCVALEASEDGTVTQNDIEE